MKIRTLEIIGIGPFKDLQFIDFTKFEQEGIFLIDGATGAGKTTILDAIIFALFKNAPRWEGSDKNKEHRSVRSKYLGSDEISSVVLVFEVFDGSAWREYRATRTIKVTAKGEEETRRLELKDKEGNFEVIEAQKTACAIRISQILGLTQEEFLKVAMLAQGQFAAFLESRSDERLELLRKLFNTERFGKLAKQVKTNANAAKELAASGKLLIDQQLGALTLALGFERPSETSDSEWLAELGSSVQSQLEPLEAAVRFAREAANEAEGDLEIAKLQHDLETLNAQVEQLERDYPTLDRQADQARLDAAERAGFVSGVVSAAADSAAAAAHATGEVAKITNKPVSEQDIGALQIQIQDIDKLFGSLEAVAAVEANIAELSMESTTAAAEVTQKETELAKIRTLIEQHEAREEFLQPIAKDLEQARTRQNETRNLVDDYRALQEKAAELVKLESAFAESQAASKYADDSFQEAALRFSDSQSAALRAKLVEGEPCSVCGSLEHPGVDSTDDVEFPWSSLEEAKIKAETANRIFEQARQARDQAKNEVAKYGTRFELVNADGLNEAWLAAQEHLEECESAYEELQDIAEKLDDKESGLRKRAADLQIKLAELVQNKNNTAKAFRDAESKTKENLCGFDSIVARRDALNTKRNELSELSRLLEELRALKATASAAEKNLKKELTKNGFATLHDFEDALLDDSKFNEIKRNLANFNDAFQRLSGLLAQEKFAGLPKTTRDLDADQARAISAREALAVAETEERAWQQRKKTYSEIAPLITADLTRVRGEIKKAEVLESLGDSLGGQNAKHMSLEAYFAASELEAVIDAANNHIKPMQVGSQYTLIHSDDAYRGSGQFGLGLEVFDQHTGTNRFTEQLSGGEKFQIALGVALGLAQVVSDRAGAIRIDSLFIDEGFGTLSDEPLNSVINTLDGLRQGGRMIGLISHGEAMKDAIATKIHVSKTPRGPSVVSIQA